MYRFLTYIVFISIFLLLSETISARPSVRRAPSEVISDVTLIKKGGVRAIRIDFGLPVHYVSHFPLKKGDTLTINLRFNRAEVPDLSELPLLQSLSPPRGTEVPLIEATYLTEADSPKLVLKFSRPVKYSVSQVMGITSLLVFLPETFKGKAKPRRRVEVDLPPIIPRSKKGGKVDSTRAEKMFRAGRSSIRQGNNNSAIQIFSSLLSMPDNQFQQDSLELLGLSRERNGQQAHAKSAYSEYLERYGKKIEDDRKNKDVERVKQRLADLLSSESRPRKRLKKGKRAKRKQREVTTDFYGNFSQYVDYAGSKEGDLESTVDATTLTNNLSLNYRLRSTNYDIRYAFNANYDYDTVDGDTDGGEISNAYVRLKDSLHGFYATAGRQSARTSGVAGKYDGVVVGYDVIPKTRVNVAAGFLVDSSDKGEIQAYRPFTTLNVEFNDFIKNWDLSPYVTRETVYGEINRQAVGTDIRYFSKKGDIFAVFERDTYFEKDTFTRILGKYNVRSETVVSFSFEKRTLPTITLESAETGMPIDDTIETLLDGSGPSGESYTVDELKQLAIDNSDESTYATVGISHSLSDVLHISLDISHSETLDRSITPFTRYGVDPARPGEANLLPLIPSDIFNGTLVEDTSETSEFTLRVVTSASFHPQDSTIVSIGNLRAQNYRENNYSIEYRRPFNKLRFTIRLRLRDRDAIERTTESSTLQPVFSTANVNYDPDLDPPNPLEPEFFVVINPATGLAETTLVSSTRTIPAKKTLRISPTIKLEYRANRNRRLYAEFNYDERKQDTDVLDDTLNNLADVREQTFSAYIGYSQDF